MSRARVTRRLTALTAATALLSAAGLASGVLVGVASAATATSVTPNGVNNAGTAPTTLKINGTGFNPQGAGQSVTLHPTLSGDEAGDIKATIVGGSSTSTQLVVTAPLYIAAPVPYDVVVTTTVPSSSTGTCSSCLIVTNPGRPTVTGVTGKGGGYISIVGTNFAKGAKVSFLKPDFTVDPALTFTAGYTDNSGLQPVHVAGITSPTSIAGQTSHGADVAAGKHYLKVTNLGDPSGSTQIVEFWQPKLSTTAPATLGQGAKNVPVTVSGQGIRTGSSMAFSSYVKNAGQPNESTVADISAGTASVAAGFDSITAPVSVSNAGGASARNVSVTGPDGGFDSHASLSITVAPVIEGNDTAVFSPLTVDTFGQGAKNVPVDIEGSNFASNAVFTGGTGVTFVTTGVTSGTTAHVLVSVAQDAPVGDVNTMTVTNPTDHGSSDYVGDNTHTRPFAVDLGPVITDISPAGITPGTSKSVTITGTGFNTANTGVGLSSPAAGGLTFSSIVVGSATTITATATLAAGQTQGPRDVTLLNKNDNGQYTCVGCMGADGLTVSPFGAANTDSSRVLTFTATGTPTLAGASAAKLHKTGGVTNQPDLIGAATADPSAYTFDLTNAAPGKYDGVVTATAGTVSCTGCFTITGNDFTLTAAPGTITPATGGQGATDFPITLHGTGFVRGEKISIAGTTISETTYVSSTTMTATITIPAALATGAKDVVVSSADGNFSHTITGGYTIVAAPVISTPKSDAPATIGQGASSFDIPITGTGFTNSSITISGADITGTVTRTDATHLVAHLTATATAATGARDITIASTDNGGSATSPGALVVTAKPVVTLVSPSKLAKGKSATFTISGQGFQSSSVVTIASVVFSGTRTVATDGTTITVDGTVSSAAALGTRNVVVDNADGGHGVCSGCFTVTAPKTPPTFTFGTNTIAAGQKTKVLISGFAGDAVQVNVKGAASSSYSVLAGLTLNSSGAGSVIVSPSTNSSYIVSNAAGASAAKTLIVKAIQTLVVQVSGHTGIFTGHVAPSVVGRTVLVYFYKTGSHVATACSTKTTSGGQFKCQHTFTPGTYNTFAQTNADKYNAAGRSTLHTNTF